MRMCDLATSVILSRSGLTRLIDRLEREGLVARQSCPQDARGSYAVLTERGRERLRAARATHLAGVRALFLERFSASELEQLGDFWDRIVGPSDGACGC
jgi:DNA-binding MarR family transcriptional regulator